MATSPPRLPNEILSRIALAANDQKDATREAIWVETLQASVQVCKVFADIFRPHIFHHCYITLTEDVEAYLGILSSKPHYQSMVKFLSLKVEDQKLLGSAELPQYLNLLSSLTSIVLQDLDLGDPAMSSETKSALHRLCTLLSITELYLWCEGIPIEWIFKKELVSVSLTDRSTFKTKDPTESASSKMGETEVSPAHTRLEFPRAPELYLQLMIYDCLIPAPLLSLPYSGIFEKVTHLNLVIAYQELDTYQKAIAICCQPQSRLQTIEIKLVSAWDSNDGKSLTLPVLSQSSHSRTVGFKDEDALSRWNLDLAGAVHLRKFKFTLALIDIRIAIEAVARVLDRLSRGRHTQDATPKDLRPNLENIELNLTSLYPGRLKSLYLPPPCEAGWKQLDTAVSHFQATLQKVSLTLGLDSRLDVDAEILDDVKARIGMLMPSMQDKFVGTFNWDCDDT